MATGQVLSPTVWAVALSALVVLGYSIYQMAGWRLLRNRQQRLGELRSNQRRVYRDLEAIQRQADSLLAKVPSAVRPAPYAADDGRAIALGNDLRALLLGLRQELRALDSGRRAPLNLWRLWAGEYRRRLVEVEQELHYGQSQRSEVARAEALAADLEMVLATSARRPLELQRSLADVQAMAETLADDIAKEEGRGTEGLVALAYEAQALRVRAMEWVERLRSAHDTEVAQWVIAAEAQRPQLLAKLWEVLERAKQVIGVHDLALDWQEKLRVALSMAEKRLQGLRPALAGVLRPGLEALLQEQRGLAARYGEHHMGAYQEVAQAAWSLTAQARSLDQEIRRLDEAERRAAEAVDGCSRGLADQEAEVEREQRQSGVELDLCRPLLGRVQRHASQLLEVWAGEVEAGQPADLASALATLARVEALADACRQGLAACAGGLRAWQVQGRRIQEALERLGATGAEHERLRRTWRDLQRFERSNWSQIEPDWYPRYRQERRALLDAADALRAGLAEGRVAESAGSEFRMRCEALEQQWQGLLHEGQRVVMALSRAEAAERQVIEGARALRADVERVQEIESELPPDLCDVSELRELGREILGRYRAVEEEARRPERTDLVRLRDEGLARLHEQLAIHKLTYAQVMEGQRASVRPKVTQLWEQWEPLNQRLVKAVPRSEIDREGLERRWQALLLAARAAPVSLRQILDVLAQAEALAQDVGRAQTEFQAEREAVREAEQRLAYERRTAAQVRLSLPRLLAHPHPQVVDEEWERSTLAWEKSDALLRQLGAQRTVRPYLARLAEATQLYVEAHARARSALVRLVRYAFLADPDGMREACLPLGRRWGRLGVTAREQHISDLLVDLEKTGRLERLLEHMGEYFGRLGGSRARPT